MAEAFDGTTGYVRSDRVRKFFHEAKFIDLLQGI